MVDWHLVIASSMPRKTLDTYKGNGRFQADSWQNWDRVPINRRSSGTYDLGDSAPILSVDIVVVAKHAPLFSCLKVFSKL